ncbi:MAG TPA: type IV pilus modification protein PilV [Noviherbaspirillum sp.]|nr:type IV pilus modification protein PilV [Noviherbaspirillum sp.]
MERKSESGYSMVEVLVSILVLSAGVLGAAGALLAATRTTQQSSYQTLALQLAAEVADSVRAYASDEQHAEALGQLLDLDYTSNPGSPPQAAASCHFMICGAEEFANAEVQEWKARLATSFPVARLRICRDANPWNDAGHAYKWDCGGGGNGAPLVIKLGWQAKNPDGSQVKDGESGFAPSVVLPVAG